MSKPRPSSGVFSYPPEAEIAILIKSNFASGVQVNQEIHKPSPAYSLSNY